MIHIGFINLDKFSIVMAPEQKFVFVLKSNIHQRMHLQHYLIFVAKDFSFKKVVGKEVQIETLCIFNTNLDVVAKKIDI